VPTQDEWLHFEILNVPASLLNSDFRMKFEFQNNGGNHVYLDNINLTLVSSLVDIDIANLDLSIAPNPANEFSTVQFNLLGEKEVLFRLVDLTGRVVQSQDLGQRSFGNHKIDLDLAGLAAGLYTVQLEIDGKTAAQRLVIE